jgi:hypothetical protein
MIILPFFELLILLDHHLWNLDLSFVGQRLEQKLLYPRGKVENLVIVINEMLTLFMSFPKNSQYSIVDLK